MWVADRSSMPRITTPSAVVDTDPTQTVVLRERFIKQLRGRWQTLRGDIRDTIDHHDALRLSDGSVDPGTATFSSRTGTGTGAGSQGRTRSRGSNQTWPFDEPTEMYRPADFAPDDDADRLEKLRQWLQYVLVERVVSPVSGAERKDGDHYTGSHIRQAFLQGVKRAGAELRHQRYDTDELDALSVLRNRNYRRRLRQLWVDMYSDLVDISQDALRAASKTASSLLRQSVSRRFFANEIIREIRDVGEKQTVSLAHSRSIEAANQAALIRYNTASVSRVGLLIEDPEGEERPFTTPWVTPETTSDDSPAMSDTSIFEETSHPIEALLDGDVLLPPYRQASRAFIRPL